jgi:hypothetical protein
MNDKEICSAPETLRLHDGRGNPLSRFLALHLRPPCSLCRRDFLSGCDGHHPSRTTLARGVSNNTTQRRNCSIQLRSFAFQLRQYGT